MSKTTYPWYNILVFVSIGLCAISGLVVIAICSYDISLVLEDNQLDQKIQREIRLIEKIDGDEGYELNGYRYVLPDHKKYSNESEFSTGELQHEGADTYKVIILLCLIASMLLGFTQFVGSLGVVCNCNTVDLRKKVKAWILAAAFIFLLGSLCLIVPLSFNVQSGKHFSVSGFSDYLRLKFSDLVEVRKNEEYLYDLFYYVFGTNEFLLLATMLITGILMPCGTQPYDSVN